jgi:hypothetical protein
MVLQAFLNLAKAATRCGEAQRTRVHGRRVSTGSPAASVHGQMVSRRRWLRSTLFCRDTTREEGSQSKEMRKREGKRKDQEPEPFAHGVDGKDRNTAASLQVLTCNPGILATFLAMCCEGKC